jgi:pimeloyl-ACP methyl ester carboxylesterase
MAAMPDWSAQYDEGVPRSLAPYPDRTLLDLLREGARERPGSPALLFKGTTLSYEQVERLAGAAPKGSVIVIHGSAGRSDSMHPLAMALARAGFTAYAPDMRGHGESGAKGRISYVGQLEDDVEDFLKVAVPPRPRVLMGFSIGGGFTLRIAGGARQKLFDRYVLLSPFIHQDAATYRPACGGWVGLGMPRWVGLTILDRLGIKLFDDLPVIAFALNDAERKFLTPSYSYSLAMNFRPHLDDYRADIRGALQPMEVLVGQYDEVFRPERFAAVFEEAGRPTGVTIVPGVSHMGLTVQPAGIEATISAVRRGEVASVAPATP